MLVTLSELIDRLVSNYDIRLKYLETDESDPSSYIYVFTASRHADLYIKTRGDQKDLARLLVRHEIAHLSHINDLIAGYREITETEKLSDADIFSGQYLDADIVHFATNIVSDYAINCELETDAYEPMDMSLLESLAASKSSDAYTVAMLILLSRHPHDFFHKKSSKNCPSGGDRDFDSETIFHKKSSKNCPSGGDRDFDSETIFHKKSSKNCPSGGDQVLDSEIISEITRLSESDQFKQLTRLVADGAEHLKERRFKNFVETVSALAGELNSVWRSDNTPWRMMKKNADVVHEHTPQYIKQEKFCEFAPETLAQKIDSKSAGSGKGMLGYDETECTKLAQNLKLPLLLERGLGIERPHLITRYRGISTSLTDKKRLVLFDSSNMWLERELEKHKQVWVLVDVSSSMTGSITSAKVLANTVHKYFRSKTTIIAFNADAYQIDIASLRCMTACGGTDVSSVLPHLNINHDAPIVLISDFKFLMTHFYAFLRSIDRWHPRMIFMPTDQEAMAHLGSMMSAWKGNLRYLIV